MDIAKTFLNTIKKYKMINAGDKILVGVSGGPDSMSLLHLLWTFQEKLEIKLLAAHLDHMFRGKESREDARFVEKICEDLGIPFFEEKINVPSYIKKTGFSPEDAARRVRYSFYKRQRKRLGIQKIALGHNRDDHEETVLMNILRGTGLEGLVGIDPVRDCYIRPLIEVPRMIIEDYLEKHNIPYRIDKTNLQPDYFRNSLRLELIPLIKEKYCPHLGKSLRRLADVTRYDLAYIEDETKKVLSSVAKCEGKKVLIYVDEFLSLHEAIKRRLIRKVVGQIAGNTKDFEYKHTVMLIDFIENSKPGSLLTLPKNLTAEKSYTATSLYEGSALKVKVPDFAYELKVPGEVFVKELNYNIKANLEDNHRDKIIKTDPLIAQLDYDKIKGNLLVRNRRRGDKFRPLGFSGSKKLKDFFIDEKIPRTMRDKIPIVECNGEILWICGMRIDDKFKVTSNTKNILILNVTNQEE